jgi:DNA (cytosine-5)-methyltransferase 1
MVNKLSQQSCKASNTPTAFDLFAGCGGLSEGLSRAGFNIGWANEFWKSAAATYHLSHRKTLLFEEDAKILLEKAINRYPGLPTPGGVDLLAGGPPCQGFSGFNRHRSPSDPRNSMVDVFLGFVQHLKPQLVLMENVPGMLTLDEGRLAELLLSSFHDLGYSCRVGLLQAGYYGLPQNRWRTFILASAEGFPLPNFPAPTHNFDRIIIHNSGKIKISPQIITPQSFSDSNLNLAPRVTVGDAISDLPSINIADRNGKCEYASSPLSSYQRDLREGSIGVTDHICPKVEAITMKRISAVPYTLGAGWLDLPDHLKPENLKRHGDGRYPNRYGRLHYDGVFNTILSRPHPYWSRIIHPKEDRLVSVRECARAQGFDDSYAFCGTISDKYKQVGNAVSPLVAAKVGRELVRAFGVANVVKE